MSGGHSHSHGGGAGKPADHRRRLAVVLALTATVLIVEVIGALVSDSLALLADAGHMLTDAAGLAIALIAATLAMRPATPKRTWGYRRAEVLGATLQAAALLAVGAYVLIEGVRRLFEPEEIATTAVLVFGVVGLTANAIGIFILTRGGRSSNVNMRAAFLEVLNDTLGSVAVLVSAVVITLTGWQQADAVASLFIAVLIIPRTLKLLRETVSVLLETTPPGLDLAEVRNHLLGVPHVLDVHDLHASQITSELPVLTAHVVIEDACFQDGHAPQLLDQLQDCLAEHFPVSIEHSTFQLEAPAHAGHEASAHE